MPDDARTWAESLLGDDLAAPHLLPVEVANVLRRAELLDAPLATLDRRILRARGPRCEFRTPDR